MSFERPQSSRRLTKEERSVLLRRYFDHYRVSARRDLSSLNQKIPRAVFAPLLDRIGRLLLEEAQRGAVMDGPVAEFLDANPLPEGWDALLPREFRAYSLALNALKQWTVAESAATDRFVLGGNARNELRSIAETCLVTGDPLGPDAELHHPVRDGRPPLPLSKAGHTRIEGQEAADEEDPRAAAILAVRAEGNRSWAMLRRGCLDLLGREVTHSTDKMRASAKTFARRAAERSGMSFDEILQWLEHRGM